jgi:hypothetical protein
MAGTRRVIGMQPGGRMVVTPAVCRVALAGTVLVLIVIAYFPFAWSPPRTVRNQVTRSADGSLRFGEMNYARTPGTPIWLQEVRTSGTVQIELQAQPQSQSQHAPMMILASDHWHTDFALGQDHSSLLVWLRRTASDSNAGPPFTVGGVLQPRQWITVNLMLQQGNLRVDVDGLTRLTEHLPTDVTRSWSQGLLALGDEVHGGRPWRGEIRSAQVRAPGYAVDYVRPGALSIPATYLYLPDHIEPPFPITRGQWLLAVLDLMSFIPLGFLLVLARTPPMRPVPATVLAASLAVALAAGKFLFHGRHTSLANIVMQAAGGLLGALLAWRLMRAKDSAAASLRTPEASTR